jgi:AraC-like DNA-binding protein
LPDPFTQVAALIQPRAPFSKVTSAVGQWRVTRTEVGRPFYCAILEGCSCLSAVGHEPMILEAGDFVLIPAPRDYAMTSVPPPAAELVSPHIVLPTGEVRLGDPDQPPDYRALVGYCVLGSPDAALLLSLLPTIIRVRGDRRLTTLVELVGEEARGQRPGKDIVLSHLLEVLFIEALRSTAAMGASPGLLRGLADDRISAALRQIHGAPGQNWTVERLAREAALSRSTFFERFQRTVGVAPMEYLTAWRMALAKDLLGRGGTTITHVAERTGYSSSSTFSTAFKRHAGLSPAQYSRAAGEVRLLELEDS